MEPSILLERRTDTWAIAALDRLGETYECGEQNYPVGHLPTRHEFAATLSACLEAALEQTQAESDLALLQQLEEEFAVELAMALNQKPALAKLSGDRPDRFREQTAEGLTSEQTTYYSFPVDSGGELVSLDFGPVVVSGRYALRPTISEAETINAYTGSIAFPDLFGRQNELGIYGGLSQSATREPLQIEAYYRLNVNEFMTFTPSLIYAGSATDTREDSSFYGALRATFSF